jgi:hypothetical protein
MPGGADGARGRDLPTMLTTQPILSKKEGGELVKTDRNARVRGVNFRIIPRTSLLSIVVPCLP